MKPMGAGLNYGTPCYCWYLKYCKHNLKSFRHEDLALLNWVVLLLYWIGLSFICIELGCPLSVLNWVVLWLYWVGLSSYCIELCCPLALLNWVVLWLYWIGLFFGFIELGCPLALLNWVVLWLYWIGLSFGFIELGCPLLYWIEFPFDWFDSSISVTEELNIKVVTGACSWLMVAAWSCVWPHFQWYHLKYATEIKSIRLHHSI